MSGLTKDYFENFNLGEALRRVNILSYPKFSAAKTFQRVIGQLSCNFRSFQNVRDPIVTLVITLNLQKQLFSHLPMEKRSIEHSSWKTFAKIFGKQFAKKAKNIENVNFSSF